MSTINSELIKEAAEYVGKFLDENLPAGITFHTLEHTKYVAQQARLIGEKSGLNPDEILIAELCAWFHDIGYAVDPEDHEKIGAEKAEEFMISKGIDEKSIEAVKNCIHATHMPQQPIKELCKVVCDADLSHLAEDDYFDRVDKMRKEWANLSDGTFSKKKFHTVSVKFFKLHEYHTKYGKKVLQPKKDNNFELLKKEIYMEDLKNDKKLLKKEGKGEKGKGKSKKEKGYSRGVESMFRLTARNQINLSSIADNKSNILISVNAIMMSITMTVLVTRFEETPNIILPTLIFLIFCLVTIVFAILSTRPNISKGTFSTEDIEQNKVNLLFFGNFYNMSLDEYEWAIGELMRNDENLYSTMIKDQFSLGKVLARKYKLLRIAYNVFMFGIIISVLAYVLAFINI